MTHPATRFKMAALAAALIVLAGGQAKTAPDQQLRGSDVGVDSDKPIAVNADNFLADLKGDTGTYTGNVLVQQGLVKLHADEVVVLAPGGKASRMEVKGHVVVDSPSGQAVGDNGIYDVATQNLHLTGHVALTRDTNIMRGTELQVSMDTGIATLTAGAQAPGETPGRVQGLFVPAQNTDPQKPAAAANSSNIKQPQQDSGQR